MALRTPPSTALIVDGDEILRDTICALLDDAGYTVLEAETPVAAMATLCTFPHAIVLIFSNTEPVDHPALRFFTEIAATPALATRHAYLYLTTTPKAMPPALTRVLAQVGAPTLAKPFELQPLLDAVALAVAQLPS
jgi:CheY-like chemotaxis protein